MAKKFLETYLQNGPGGSQIVMEGTHSVTGNNLIDIGYKYSSSGKVLFYVATPDAGSMLPGLPYKMRFTDMWVLNVFYFNSNSFLTWLFDYFHF